MAKNTNLQKAKAAKNDEFYTRREDIENELSHYIEHFRDKTIYCNCDDPDKSNFPQYFLDHFEDYGIKRLICSCFVKGGQGKYMIYNGKSRQDGVLVGDGDFRSDECIDFLKQADIVVTNPPFSLFREYVAQLIEYDKKFLIIGNVNAITYKEIFPLIKENKMWIGASIHSGDRAFYVPDDYPLNAAGCGIDPETGRKFIRVKGVRWFTNLDYKGRHAPLDLRGNHYYGNEDKYPKYDNYDAINIDRTSIIPCDYDGWMGVPITAIDRISIDEYELKRPADGLIVGGEYKYKRLLIRKKGGS